MIGSAHVATKAWGKYLLSHYVHRVPWCIIVLSSSSQYAMSLVEQLLTSTWTTFSLQVPSWGTKKHPPTKVLWETLSSTSFTSKAHSVDEQPTTNSSDPTIQCPLLRRHGRNWCSPASLWPQGASPPPVHSHNNKRNSAHQFTSSNRCHHHNTPPKLLLPEDTPIYPYNQYAEQAQKGHMMWLTYVKRSSKDNKTL